jgi:chromosome segregation ATPase
MSERCDDCGTELIDKCAVCGAPVCCPLCCARSEITRLRAEVERLKWLEATANRAGHLDVAMQEIERQKGLAEHYETEWGKCAAYLNKVAGERDRLRSEVDQLMLTNGGIIVQWTKDIAERDSLRAEVERLRAEVKFAHSMRQHDIEKRDALVALLESARDCIDECYYPDLLSEIDEALTGREAG